MTHVGVGLEKTRKEKQSYDIETVVIMKHIIRFATMMNIKKIVVALVIFSVFSIWLSSRHILSRKVIVTFKSALDKPPSVKTKVDTSLPLSSQQGLKGRNKPGKASFLKRKPNVPFPFATGTQRTPGQTQSPRDQGDRSPAFGSLVPHNTTGQRKVSPNNLPGSKKGTKTRLKLSVLVVIESSDIGVDNLQDALEANRINFATILASRPERAWPIFEYEHTGAFSVIIFQNILSYHTLDGHLLNTIHEYCRKYGVGILAFAQRIPSPSTRTLLDLPISMDHRVALCDLTISPAAGDVLHITKAGREIGGNLLYSSWTVFTSNHSSYRHLVQAKLQRKDGTKGKVPHTTMLLDKGQYDGIQRIFIGNDLRFWLHYILFLDSVSYLSHGLLKMSLDRYIQVDIDDIFVGKHNRLTHLDVKALITKQRMLASKVPGFTFKLGFSGRIYGHGNEDEIKGDKALAENAHVFSWFPHMWGHNKAHTYDNQSKLTSEMLTNYKFAQEHNITVNESYAVAPYHSGVYPAHDMLYKAWKQVWGIRVTSTEEYPALFPRWNRKGFIFKDIMVLPRQTCTLFTKTTLMSNYNDGKDGLDSVIQGGEVFHTVINNPINVFMTHMPNYSHDRLALYLFDKLVMFVQKWTNIKLKTAPPLELARMYFEMFPWERKPLWTNPCSYKRHLEILPKLQSCDKIPNVLVLGPQKTGTSALRSFLLLHPNIFSNHLSKVTYEELQFFSSTKNYEQGVEWYMSYFPQIKRSTDILFEKSATYFESEHAPLRARSLLKKAKLITILIHPTKRAYSWYQHERARANPASMNYTFYDVITSSGPGTNKHVASLRNRCLNPGKYIEHLKKWLQYYPASQMMVVDGDLLKRDPVTVMWKVQSFLELKNVVNFKNKIKYDEKKGFYCPVKDGHTQCLANNKGRRYPSMDSRSKEYLSKFYQTFNAQLKYYLISIGQPVPSWLNTN